MHGPTRHPIGGMGGIPQARFTGTTLTGAGAVFNRNSVAKSFIGPKSLKQSHPSEP